MHVHTVPCITMYMSCLPLHNSNNLWSAKLHSLLTSCPVWTLQTSALEAYRKWAWLVAAPPTHAQTVHRVSPINSSKQLQTAQTPDEHSMYNKKHNNGNITLIQ